MDSLSASVSSFNLSSSLPPLPQKSIFHRFKATVNATTASSATGNLSKPTQFVSHHRNPTSSSSSYSHNKNPSFPRTISFSLAKPSRAPPKKIHEKAASGYAAALVSVCQSKNCLGRTQEDVVRLMEFLVGEEKWKVLVNDVIERGKFGKHLKGLVKMLITKGKLGILGEVLMEFERICDELVIETTKLVWVS